MLPLGRGLLSKIVYAVSKHFGTGSVYIVAGPLNFDSYMPRVTRTLHEAQIEI
jgi:hypothetical protein